MKIRLFNLGILASVLLMTLSGCSSDETFTNENDTAVKSMKINISDGLFTSVDDSGAKTRATDNGTGTTFASGDAIGIFAVKPDGTVVLANAKYTYDSTSKWLNSNSTENLPYFEGAKYFAYYPYQTSMDGKYSASGTFSDLTAETFFGSLISSWTPAADQSTQAQYTAQDLMVSMAAVNASTYSSSFTMSHQMSIVEIDLHQVHYTYNGADKYRFTFDATSKPFNVAAGKYRLLVNPNNTLSVTGNNQYNSTDAAKTKGWKISGAAPAASKYKIYKYKGASACLTQTSRQNVCLDDANIGDYLYADGTTGTTTGGKTIVGIVFSNEISSAEYNAGYTHGYAIALKDAGTEFAWGPIGGSANTTKVTVTSNLYNDISSGYDGTFTKGYKSYGGYPVWQVANNYNVNVAGFTNSGWYLPSAGQLWDICANIGKSNSISSMQTYNGDFNIFPIFEQITYNINNALLAAGGDKLSIDDSFYWSSSEYDVDNAVLVEFDSAFFAVYQASKMDGNSYLSIRSVLAF